MKYRSAYLILVMMLTMGQVLNAQGQLSADEKANGWISLFDGKTTDGWRTYNKSKIGSSWVVQDGALTLVTDEDGEVKDGGAIVSDIMPENFELSLEWKISECGNSGIMYNVVEKPSLSRAYHSGPELQVLDNSCHPDAKIHKHRAGDLYDLIASDPEVVKPAGEWNTFMMKIEDDEVEVHLNGTKVLAYTMHDDNWHKMIANSKFKDMGDFGKHRQGRIALQDHSDPVWFRNIKYRPLD